MLQLLFEEEGLAHFPLPGALADARPGGLGFTEPVLYSNFVMSADGVVNIRGIDHVGRMLSGGVAADKFMMGMLRAFADAVLVGAGTLRGGLNSRWAPESAFPSLSGPFAELRGRLGKGQSPELVVVTSGGGVDLSHPGFQGGGLVVATRGASGSLPVSMPPGVEKVIMGDSAVDWTELLLLLRERGHSTVLSEAGPTVMGQLLAQDLVDELFLTVSPRIAGGSGKAERPGLARGIDFLPDRVLSGRLASVHRAQDHLFLRYRYLGDRGFARPGP